jgi:hypothetical protein
MDADLLYTNSKGKVASFTTTGNIEEGEVEWNIIGRTTTQVCTDGMDYADDPHLLDELRETDEFGNFLTMEPARDPGWYQAKHHTDGFIPVTPHPSPSAPWYRYLDHKMPVIEGNDGQFEFTTTSRGKMRRSSEDLWDLIFALSEHPEYDTVHTRRPEEFDVSQLDASFSSDEEAQVVAASAR